MANEGYPAGNGGSVSATQLLLRLTGAAALATGALLYGDGDASLATLAPGTNGHVLTLAGGLPTWAASPAAALPGSYAVGDLLYASGAAALAKLAAVATGNALISGGVTTAPAWGKIGLTTHVSGILPSANGGTGVNNAGTLTNAGNTTITGGGTVDLGGFTLTVPASGTAGLLGAAATWSGLQTFGNAQTVFGLNSGAVEARINGGNSGSASGARLSVWNNGSSVLQFGNKSAVLGGAYDATPYFYSNGTVEFSGAATFAGAAATATQVITGGGTTSAAIWQRFTNSGGQFYFGIERSSGAFLFSAGTAYATVLGTSNTTVLEFGTNGIIRGRFLSTGELNLLSSTVSVSAGSGAFTVAGGIGVGGASYFQSISGSYAMQIVNTNAVAAPGLFLQAGRTTDFAMRIESAAGAGLLTLNGSGVLSVIGTGSQFVVTSGTITSDAPTISATQTWNSGGVTFTGWKLDVTDTASASASLLLDLQVGGSSKASIAKTGQLRITGGTVTTSAPMLNLTQTWNAVGVTFQGALINVTTTTSAAASTYLDVQEAGTSLFKVGKFGKTTLANYTASDYALSITSLVTLLAGVTDSYLNAINLAPNFLGSQAITRHNYIRIADPTLGSNTLGDACVFAFDAAAGTHKAIDSGTTKTSPGTVSAWVKININGTVHYVPAYTSKTT